MASVLASVTRWVTTFVSVEAIFPDGHGEAVAVQSLNGDYKDFRCVLSTDGVTTIDPRNVVFTTLRRPLAEIRKESRKGSKRAARQRVNVHEAAFIKGPRFTFAQIALRMATIGKDQPGFGLSGHAERTRLAKRMVAYKGWETAEFV